MLLVNAKQMRQIDQAAIEKFGIPEMVLMENAGRTALQNILSYIESREDKYGLTKKRPWKWVILVGKGNNGGDALVIARALHELDHQVEVLYALPPQQLRGSAALQRDMIEQLPIPVNTYSSEEFNWSSCDAIIDGLLGTGSSGPPREPYASLINAANQCDKPIFALDLPSGIDANNGQVYQPCIKAELTLALGLLKRGHAVYPGKENCGNIRLCPIGIPPSLTKKYEPAIRTYLIDEEFLQQHVPKWFLPRTADTHKGSYGHTFVAAGSTTYSGAGLLCSKSALQMGCGLVTWSMPERLSLAMAGQVPELILSGEPDQQTGTWEYIKPEILHEKANGKQAVLLGCGIGRFDQDGQWIRQVIGGLDEPLVLDADALNMLTSDNTDQGKSWNSRRSDAPTIITPHPGEMARLMNISTNELQQQRLQYARQYAAMHQVIVVLKGAATVIAEPDGALYVNSSGNPYMAVGGMGDVLAGMIAGVLAQGYTAGQACLIAVYYHGVWSDQLVRERKHPSSITPSNLLQHMQNF